MARPKSTGGEKKPSVMGMVRTILQEMGGDGKPQEIHDKIKERFNTEVPNNIISNYKSQIRSKAGATGGGRRGRRGSGGIPVADLEVVRGLVNRLGAAQVKQLVDVLS